MHYVFLYEGSQWKQKAMAVGVVLAIFAVVLFPLWPVVLRQGVWYLSVGMMGLLAAFFAMAIFRLILFCVTVFVVPPGLWLFPNLFEDVGFFDSFKPLWGWQEVCFTNYDICCLLTTNTFSRRRRRKSNRPRKPSLLQLMRQPMHQPHLRKPKLQQTLLFLPLLPQRLAMHPSALLQRVLRTPKMSR